MNELIALSALQQRGFVTGTGRYIVELLRAMATLEPSRSFLLYAKTDQQRAFAIDRPNVRQRLVEECPTSPMKRSLWEWRRFPGVLRQDSVGLYHGPANFLPLRKVCPYVLTLHDMFFFRNPKRTNLVRSLYWRWSIRLQWRLADVIITDSEFSRREILHFLPVPPDRVHVVPLGIAPRFFRQSDAAERQAMREALGIDRPYLLYVGRLDPDKNPEGVIRAFGSLRARGRGPELLVVAGAQDHQSERLPAVAAEVGCADRVRFTGYAKEEHLQALYQECEVFCYPSFNEGFGFPPLEAMATGAPVVTSNLSSLPEVVGDAAITVDPHSVEAIAAGIEAACEPVRRRELAEAGPKHAATFTWERTARHTLELYGHALERAGRAGGR